MLAGKIYAVMVTETSCVWSTMARQRNVGVKLILLRRKRDDDVRDSCALLLVLSRQYSHRMCVCVWNATIRLVYPHDCASGYVM